MSKILVLFIAGTLPLAAQSNAGSSAGTSTGTTTTTTTTTPSRTPTPTPSTNSTQTNQNTTTAPPPRPIFIAGKVMTEDGLPVPPNVVIQTVCGASPRSVAYTDSKGRFSFQWGQTSGMFMSASESSSMLGGINSAMGMPGSSGTISGSSNPSMSQSLMGCDLQANIAGYRSDVLHMYNHSSTDNPDVGIIILHRLANVEGTSVSMTSLLAPKDAKKAFDRAQQSLLKSKNDDALKDFEKAVAIYPKYADAWAAMGKLQVQQKATEQARESFMKAVEVDPKLVFPQIELGLMSADARKWEDAAKYLQSATKLDPVDYPQAWYVLSVANYNLKQFDAAEKSAREAVKLDPKHKNPRSDYLLGLVLAEKRDYAGAAAELKIYMDLMPTAEDIPVVKKQLGQLQSFLAGAQTPGEPPSGVRE